MDFKLTSLCYDILTKSLFIMKVNYNIESTDKLKQPNNIMQ